MQRFLTLAMLVTAATAPAQELVVPVVPTAPVSGSSPLLNELLATEADFADVPMFQSREIQLGWWQPMVQSSLRPDVSALPLTLENVLVRALTHSRQIQVFAELPLIRESAIVESDAAFDWHAFLDSRWDDSSDPVGNSLTAGPGITRFRDHQLNFSAGARKRTAHGGRFEAAQRYGMQNNNSQFFIPNDQGTARLVLSYTHPLMRGRGKAYNRSLVCLAAIDKRIADDEFHRQLQSHLLEASRAYWALHLERGVLLQKMNSYRRAKTTVGRLQVRNQIDASDSQIISAEAALKTRGAELMRARMAVKNAASRLRSLVNDPSLAGFDQLELIPLDVPSTQTIEVDMQSCMAEAVRFRPEIAQAIKQIKAASVRCKMSKNELMPALNLVTETYVAGLEDQHDVWGAWGNQFSVGEPGYSLGLQFEVPLHNRAAKARHARRRHELRQMRNKYQLALETVKLEVEIAVREVSTSQRELFAKERAMRARQEQMDYIEERWLRLPGEGASASLTLENLLTAQERLAAAEFDYLRSQLTYNLSLTNLNRVTGILLLHEQVSIDRYCDCGLPTQVVSKPELERLPAAHDVTSSPPR